MGGKKVYSTFPLPLSFREGITVDKAFICDIYFIILWSSGATGNMEVLLYSAVTGKKESTQFISSSLVSYNSGAKERLPIFSLTCKEPQGGSFFI